MDTTTLRRGITYVVVLAVAALILLLTGVTAARAATDPYAPTSTTAAPTPSTSTPAPTVTPLPSIDLGTPRASEAPTGCAPGDQYGAGCPCYLPINCTEGNTPCETAPDSSRYIPCARTTAPVPAYPPVAPPLASVPAQPVAAVVAPVSSQELASTGMNGRAILDAVFLAAGLLVFGAAFVLLARGRGKS